MIDGVAKALADLVHRFRIPCFGAKHMGPAVFKQHANLGGAGCIGRILQMGDVAFMSVLAVLHLNLLPSAQLAARGVLREELLRAHAIRHGVDLHSNVTGSRTTGWVAQDL